MEGDEDNDISDDDEEGGLEDEGDLARAGIAPVALVKSAFPEDGKTGHQGDEGVED